MKITEKQLRQVIKEELNKLVHKRKPMKEATDRYTAFVDFGGETEEIDVDASSEREARTKAEAQLQADYEPGGKIVRIIKRVPGTFY